uniref:Uncharacterized protein n=1 Tax=Aegilops tauschii subsp. strangulata TaxID=200361 RepID=A0A453SX93_AEGTS
TPPAPPSPSPPYRTAPDRRGAREDNRHEETAEKTVDSRSAAQVFPLFLWFVWSVWYSSLHTFIHFTLFFWRGTSLDCFSV